MKKSDSRSPRGGFTLIEVVVSIVLLAVVCTGSPMMTAVNAGQMSREQRLEQSNYNLSVRAGQGRGDPTGETTTVEFSPEGTNQVREMFERYEATGLGEDADSHMTFYRYG